MAKVLASELTGMALRWAVARCEGLLTICGSMPDYRYAPDEDWSQGGSILDKWKCALDYRPDGRWDARHGNEDGETVTEIIGADTALIAVMRCYVTWTMGDTVDIPDELLASVTHPPKGECMADKELLELAAKAAGIEITWHASSNEELLGAGNYYIKEGNRTVVWNPLTSDGDALRLAVKLDISLPSAMGNQRYVNHPLTGTLKEVGDDPYAATRRAIVRAAAELGKGEK